jgi:hypothetical protein
MISGRVALTTMIVVSLAIVGWRRRRHPGATSRNVAVADGAAAVALVGVAAALLLAMGRVPTYRHGGVRLYAGNVNGDENSQQLTDPYTFTHVTHGIVFYALLRLVDGRSPVMLRAVTAIAIESAWEVLENTSAVIERYRATTMAQGYYGDSVVNSAGDIAATVVGFAIAAWLSVRATIIVAMALETMLLLWIRDNLLLNVLMLLWPLDVVRVWQRGG